MRHHTSAFHQLLQFVPWDRFEHLVAAHSADRRVRRLTTRSQLVALMYGQLAGAQSLPLRHARHGLPARWATRGARAGRRGLLFLSARAHSSLPMPA